MHYTYDGQINANIFMVLQEKQKDGRSFLNKAQTEAELLYSLMSDRLTDRVKEQW